MIQHTTEPAPKPTAEARREFRDVPAGKYRAYCNRIRVDQTKTGKPRLSIGWRVAGGDFSGEWVWDSVTLTEKGYVTAAAKLGKLCPLWVQPEDWDAPCFVEAEAAEVAQWMEAEHKSIHTIDVRVDEQGFKRVYICD